MGVAVPGTRIWSLAGDAAANTPAGRDRVVDLLRGGSLAVVVVGHTLMSVVEWNNGVPRLGNLLAELPRLQALTWVFQVMPLFFAAGAVASAGSWSSASARGASWQQWMWGRTARLVRPVVYYLAVWVPLVVALQWSVGERAAAVLARLSTQLLWFLGIYLVVVATTPLQVRFARRPGQAMVGFAAVIVASDLARFHIDAGVGLINFVVVWVGAATFGLIVHQHRGDRRWAAVAAVAVAVNAAVILAGPYPWSMVGMPGEKISNMAPPTLVLALHAVALIAVVGAAWGALGGLCERPRVWHATCAVGGVAMTLYLWHLTALIGVTVAEHLLGADRPPVDHRWFWPATVAHLAVALIAVAAVTIAAAPLEHLAVPWLETRTPARRAPVVVSVCGVVLAGVGLLALAATGMGGFPFGRSVTYLGIPITPGAALAVAAAGVLCVRAGAGGGERTRNSPPR